MAMPMRMRVNINQHAITELGLPGGVVDQGVERAAGTTRDRAKQNLTDAGRVDTGSLRQSIVKERSVANGAEVTWQVGSPMMYGQWSAAELHERGTGIYGPHHSPIYPRVKRVLRFKPKGATAFVFAPTVRGMEGTRFLERALYQLTTHDFTR